LHEIIDSEDRDWEFFEDVARTNNELVRGYKRLQNEF